MRARRWIGSLIIAISAASLATASFADIPAFNAAVKAGDYKKAARSKGDLGNVGQG